MTSVVEEIVWLVGILEEMNMKVNVPVNLFCDTKAFIQIAENTILHERTKHIEIDYHFARKRYKRDGSM